MFRTCPDRTWGPSSLLYNGYLFFPWGQVLLGRAADHSPPSNTKVMEEQSYTSTHPLGHNRTCNGINVLPFFKKLGSSMLITFPQLSVTFLSSSILCSAMFTTTNNPRYEFRARYRLTEIPWKDSYLRR
jgi:hypothetical protein